LVEMRSCKLLPGLALNSNPPNLSLSVARFTDVSRQHLASLFFFLLY
jgi:hypothetical protein